MTIVMIGATGAVGRRVVERLARRADVHRLTLLGRRPLDGPWPAHVQQHVVDVADGASYQPLLAGHTTAICTLGVGQPSEVSREEFIRSDRDTPLAFGTACRAAGVSHFELLGSVGASPSSRSFYLRAKGELEAGLEALGFPRLSLFQPSMILTPTNRYGFSQGLLLATWPAISALLVGPLRPYRGIRVEALAAAIANNLATTGAGVERLRWDAITAVAARAPAR